MRISIDPSDPGYAVFLWHRGGHFVVFLDDIIRADIITADEEARTIVKFQRNAKGLFMVSQSHYGALETETLRGVVRIHLNHRTFSERGNHARVFQYR